MAKSISPERVRAFWWTRQRLGGAGKKLSAKDVLVATGWQRSVGGCNPYLALRARAGLSRAEVDDAVAKLQIHELPSARGCTYVVPAPDFALALRAGQGHGDAAAIATAKKHLGVTDKELDKLEKKVLRALEKGPLDPAEIKEAAGDAVRSLGAEGKKRGTTTTLPLALGRLQSHGKIRRVPIAGRLDQQRYKYAAWEGGPLDKWPDDAEVARELARRFFRWAAPATVAQLAWWSGLGVKASRAAAGELGLVPLEDGSDRLLFPDDLDALLSLDLGSTPRLAFVSSLDNLMHLRREVAPLADAEPTIPGHKGPLLDLPYHAIVDRGRLAGLWDYDGVKKEVVFATFGGALKKEARAAADELAAWVASDLGDVRAFSLDSPESRAGRIDLLRRAKV